ncbi:MAG: phosphohydrolase, partial [Spirochaetes bacterium]|nr:phosphohydrolase [Spirochaetota bacterium]
IFETAILAARYPLSLDQQAAIAAAQALPEQLPGQYQQDLLLLLLDSAHPERGFELLRHCGFLERYWPELADLDTVDHAKDFHPEGDAWRHTMETFSHRKTKDLVLSLGLLLHDIGKPDASANAGRRFDGHADIGGQQALRFLRRLGFPERLAQDVFFLVRYHMMPAALPVLPVYRVEEQLRHPLFPVLLELYRCDELSTFRGPDGYYAACAAYRDWCRHTKNPYRLADGRKRQDKNLA